MPKVAQVSQNEWKFDYEKAKKLLQIPKNQ